MTVMLWIMLTTMNKETEIVPPFILLYVQQLWMNSPMRHCGGNGWMRRVGNFQLMTIIVIYCRDWLMIIWHILPLPRCMCMPKIQNEFNRSGFGKWLHEYTGLWKYQMFILSWWCTKYYADQEYYPSPIDPTGMMYELSVPSSRSLRLPYATKGLHMYYFAPNHAYPWPHWKKLPGVYCSMKFVLGKKRGRKMVIIP